MNRTLRVFFFLLMIAIVSCGKQSEDEVWTTSPGVQVTAYKTEPENGKQFLNVIYENFGEDTVDKIKYELITMTNGKYDTTTRVIDPGVYLKPKDRHLVKRGVGEEPVTFDEVSVGRIWVQKR
jgi:hypothetical protein